LTEHGAQAVACAAELALHNGQDPVALDLSGLHGWTDYFVIASATSSTHLRGMARHLLDFCAARGIEVLRQPRIGEDEEWVLVDCGWLVVHLMSARAREFYELEKLWFQAEKLPVPAPRPAGA